MYWNILDRDVENQAAVDNWTKHTYTHGLAHTLGSFFTSPEYSGRGLPTEVTVDKLYWVALGRQADTAERIHWVERIKNGASLWQVANGFIDCPEYKERVRTGKAPDPVYWPTN